jgi:gluconolactonase
LNDLHFASNGDLYFTDQGQTGIADPTGRVFRLRANGALDRLCTNVPSPNGITLSTTEKHCYVAVTPLQQIWRLPLMADGSISKTGVAVQLSGGAAGPDGIEMDAENGSSSVTWALACGASTATCCPRTSFTRTTTGIITWRTSLLAVPI